MTGVTGGKRIRRRIDHLGHIRERLQDLTGFDTLANELIQNAEDAGATTVIFDVRRDALVVDNDEHFTDCGRADDQSLEECPLKADGRPSCDWHNLTEVAAGQKRDRAAAIGKFGIGFLAVYQLTDRPEIISGRHWALEEDKAEEDRIFQCSGDDGCRSIPGTRILLPYALDPKAGLRQRLGVAAVSSAGIESLPEILARAAVSALIFLDSVNSVEIRRNGRPFRRIVSLNGEGPGGIPMTIISGEGVDETWYRLHGSFDDDGNALKARYDAELIERDRGTTVRLAIPATGEARGLLYAGLPSDMVTGLPFHLDARFFPSSDRKRMPFDAGEYRGQWNQAAMRAGARVLADGLIPLRTALGPSALWTMILRVSQAAGGDPVTVRDMQLGLFKSLLAAKVAKSAVAFTASGRWVPPNEAPVLREAPEERTVEVLAAVGIDPMDPALRSIAMQGLVAADFGTRFLTIDHLLAGLQAAGLDRAVAREQTSPALHTHTGLTALWSEIERLLTQERGTDQRAAAARRLKEAAIAPSGGLLVPLARAYRTDERGRGLVAALNLPVTLLDEGFAPDAPVALGLCPTFDLSTLVALAEAVPTDWIEQAWRIGSFDPDELLEWIEGREIEVTSAPRVLARLRSLVMFPTAVAMVALEHAVVAGDFDDPLRLTEVLTIDTNRHRRVLEMLGVPKLTFTEFARRQAPRALADAGLDAETRRQVIRTLAHRVHDLQADVEARAALSPLPLVECVDGEFRDADEVVLASSDGARVVEGTIPLARAPDGDISFELFWSWLGIHQRPTVAQLEARIDDLTEETPDADRIRAMEAVARHLKERIDETPIREFVQELRDREWLPVRGEDEWSTPQDVYSVFNEYLFESTGRFLAFGRETQTELSNTVFRELGMGSDPTTDLVVGHVLNWSAEGRAVNPQVWDYLARHAPDPPVTRLRGTRCIWTGTTYRRPNEVFWADHPFGAYRAKLPIQNLIFRPFFDAVGVRDEPTAMDARAVLAEVRAAAGEDRLDDEDARVVRGTWELLADLEDEDDEIGRLRNESTAVDRRQHLVEPARLYFEDRPRLSLLFDDDIRRRIIDFDPAIAPALRKAGARDLSVALQIAKLEPGDPRDDPKIDALVADRAHAITRVAATVGADLDTDDVRALVWQRVDNLRVRYELPDEPGRAATDEETPEALFIEEEVPTGIRRVIYVAVGVMPLRAMARELAVGLVGPRSVPVLAAALHTVLAGASATDAEAALDDLGLARLGDDDDLGPAVMEVAKDLGIDEGASNEGKSPPHEETSSESSDSTPAKPASTATDDDADRREGKKDREKGRQDKPGGSTHSRGVLRSHLPRPTDDGGDRDGDEDAADHRSAVDRAGVDHVLAYERSHGRNPTEMDHWNVGFDVESYNDENQLVRVIEVKSMSGSWLDATPALSRPQHDAAFTRGPEYWLYVVERALEASAEVHTIRDPIRRATEFGFDPGWIEVADLDASEDDAPQVQ